MKRLFITSCVVLLMLVVLSTGAVQQEGAAGYRSHAPIYIEGNDGFTAENGIISGSGTAEDPYIIKGWEIDASSGNGIAIVNTNKYFIIRDCRVFGASRPGATGIVLDRADRGKVEYCEIVNNHRGLLVQNSSAVKISGCRIHDNNYGLSLWRTSNSLVFRNEISGNSDCGIYLNSSSVDNLIYENNFLNNVSQACLKSFTSAWDSGVEGNYWNDYEERYPEVHSRWGIWDKPYEVEANSSAYDNHPLEKPIEDLVAWSQYVVINEVQYYGQWVELYNPTDERICLHNCTLKRTQSQANTVGITKLEQCIEPGSYLVVPLSLRTYSGQRISLTCDGRRIDLALIDYFHRDYVNLSFQRCSDGKDTDQTIYRVITHHGVDFWRLPETKGAPNSNCRYP